MVVVNTDFVYEGGRSAVHGGCEAGIPRQHPYRPMPDPFSGELKVDPDILLKAKKFDLAINFYYSSQSDLAAEYGVGRAASVRGYVLSSTSTNDATVVRGDHSMNAFQLVGTSGGITTYSADVLGVTSLTFDGTQFTEAFNDGMKMVYQAQVGGGNPVKHELIGVIDAAGPRHTYTYGTGSEAGLLKTVEVPGGNLVILIYAPGTSVSLLSAIQDFGGRRWTFQYDAAQYLTTYITPLGCSTKYSYSAVSGAVSMLHTIEDPRGFLTTYLYDSDRRVASMTAGTAGWSWNSPWVQQIRAARSSPRSTRAIRDCSPAFSGRRALPARSPITRTTSK